MKRQRGYTLVETMVSICITAIASVIVAMAVYQVVNGTRDNNDHIDTVHQVQNAGYWISHDAQMAVSVNTSANLTFPNFLQFGWTEWDSEGNSDYNRVQYSFVDGVDNLYSLKRSYTSSGGTDEESIVANNIFYDPGEEYSSNSTYTGSVILVNLTAMYNSFRETREFMVKRRPGI